uniref:Trafficking protein particle complex subunit 2-like protein n=1 Tax=Piliocolobus tephrosceles TaxID=591936 RepID=A0A8C9LUI6_9PRIM
MAVCIAAIAKENYLLYIRSTATENELKFHYMVHISLDVVDEKISAMGKALLDQRELYLGLGEVLSTRCRKHCAGRLAQHRVATNFQFVKITISAKCNKAKRACA